MGSRLRENPSNLFDLFAEVCLPQREEEPFIRLKYPDTFAEEDVLKQLPAFAFPCELESNAVEHFTFTFTNIEGKHRFGFCRMSAGGASCLCIVSWLPWFDIFYKILNKLSDVLNSKYEDKGVISLLLGLYEAKVPAAGETCYIASKDGVQELQFVAPHAGKLPCHISDRNLNEYCNVLDYYKRIVIFASLLHERRIIFTSLKMSRLSACIHACASLLYPMHWQHIYLPVLPRHLLDYCSAPMPYLIGVHAYLMDKVRKMDIGDAVIVNTDHNEITSRHDDVESMPQEVYSMLKKRLKAERETGGDYVARTFLRALVMLIGGYREGAKLNGTTLEFRPESFLMTRPPSMRPFLAKMLELQIVSQFIDERLELLNNKRGYHDEFEIEIIHWAQKVAMSHSKYKDLVAGAKKFQKGSKEQITGLASMVKAKSRNAMKTIKRRLHEDSKHDDGQARRSKHILRINSYKQSMVDHVDTDADTGSRDNKRLIDKGVPARPPLPHLMGKLNVVNRGSNEAPTANRRESYNKARHYNPLSFDDDEIATSRISVNLMDDPDIQSVVKKSYSMEDITADDCSEDNDTGSESSDASEDILGDIAGISSPIAPPRRKPRHPHASDVLAELTDGSSINSSDSSGLASHLQPSVLTENGENLTGSYLDIAPEAFVPQQSAPHESSTSLTPISQNAASENAAGRPVQANNNVAVPKGSATQSVDDLLSHTAPQHSSEPVPADPSKAGPVRRSTAPRIEQLQKELIDKVQSVNPPKRPLTSPAFAVDASFDVGRRANDLASLPAAFVPRKDVFKRQTIFGDPRRLQPHDEEEEEAGVAVAISGLSNQGASSCKSAEAWALSGSSSSSSMDVRQPMLVASNSSLQLHEDLIGLELEPAASTDSTSATSSTAAASSPVCPDARPLSSSRANYYVSLPQQHTAVAPTRSVRPIAGATAARGGSLCLPSGKPDMLSAEAVAQSPFLGAAAWPALAVGGTSGCGKQLPPGALAAHGTAASARHSSTAECLGADLLQCPPLKPKQLHAAPKSPSNADPFADLVNLKSHMGAPAAQF